MLTQQFKEKQSNALISYKRESFEYLTREYQYKLKEGFQGLGIRYLTYCKKDQTLLISNISNGRVHLLNLYSGGLRSFVNHSATVRKIILFNDEIYTASWDGTVRATNYLTLQQRRIMTQFAMGRCPFINISPDGKYLFSFTYDSDIIPFGVANIVRKWDMKSGKLLKVLVASAEQIGTAKSGAIIIHQGQLYVCSNSGYFRIFDMATGKRIKEIRTGSDFRSMTSVLHYNFLLASDWEGYIHFFNLESKSIDFKMKCHNTDIFCIRVHPGNPDIIFTSSADGVIKVWEMPGFVLLNTILANHNDLWSMVFINDHLVIGNIDGEIQVYDIADVRHISYKGRIVLSDQSFVVQAVGSKMFYTNDISAVEVYREPDNNKVTGKESEYLLGQGNNLMVLRGLFGLEDRIKGLLPGNNKLFPLIPESLM